jgi:predicted nucleotidyltransferase
MKPSELLELHREEIRAIVLRNNAHNPRVFGSVLAATDTESSDLDILIEPLSSMSLFDIGAIRYELKELLKIEVDVLTPGALPSRWKDVVLQEAKPI